MSKREKITKVRSTRGKIEEDRREWKEGKMGK